MALHRELRPQTFAGIYGNRATVASLKKFVAMSPEKHPHSYMFHGPYGCGKTTFARILANEFGCGEFGLIELNAANTRGIDTVRQIIEESAVYPLSGKCRVYILDEAQQLSKDAKSALLKITEDTPLHTYFILCTTEPNAILPTIRSRCSQYQVELLNTDDMIDLVWFALDKIDRSLDEEVFVRLLNCADGRPRDVLKLLDQIAPIDNPEIQMELLKKASVEHETIELCRALLYCKSWSEVAEIYRGLPNTDSEMVRRAVMGYMKSVIIKGKINDRAAFIIGVFQENTFNGGEPQLIRMMYECCR